MDSWQKEIIDKLRVFVNQYPPSTYPKIGEVEVEIQINSKEAYTLLNIAEQWAMYSSPIILIDPKERK